VITSAASIMVVVFGAFALGDFVLVKILGVALAAAIVLDATLVRLAVGPALLALAGRWNWWPGSIGSDRGAPRRRGENDGTRIMSGDLTETAG
jgi:RND superfamily putative drug exporter